MSKLSYFFKVIFYLFLYVFAFLCFLMVWGVYIKLVMYVAALLGINTSSMGILFIILGIGLVCALVTLHVIYMSKLIKGLRV